MKESTTTVKPFESGHSAAQDPGTFALICPIMGKKGYAEKFCMTCGKWRVDQGFSPVRKVIKGKTYKRMECPTCAEFRKKRESQTNKRGAESC